MTELYTAAAEQLGSDKAPVRLAALYALERVGQGTSTQRQTVVNVWCAYLRMPYTAPPEPDDDGQRHAEAAGKAREEREVRLTAQRLLATHLRPGADTDHPLTPDVQVRRRASRFVWGPIRRLPDCGRTATVKLESLGVHTASLAARPRHRPLYSVMVSGSFRRVVVSGPSTPFT